MICANKYERAENERERLSKDYKVSQDNLDFEIEETQKLKVRIRFIDLIIINIMYRLNLQKWLKVRKITNFGLIINDLGKEELTLIIQGMKYKEKQQTSQIEHHLKEVEEYASKLSETQKEFESWRENLEDKVYKLQVKNDSLEEVRYLLTHIYFIESQITKWTISRTWWQIY